MRERALRRAREVGAAQAARELGVPAATVRSWRRRAGESGPPVGVDPNGWAEQRRLPPAMRGRLRPRRSPGWRSC
jgi:transposase-like protein